MARDPRRRRKLNLQHFKGLSDLAEDPTFARYIQGLVDRPGGNLSRLGGLLAATSEPFGSIWTLAQLRFRDQWGFAVHNTSTRLWYDHGVQAGQYDGLLDFPTVPDGESDENPNIGEGEYEPPINPTPNPVPECQSWWDWRYGVWEEEAIADCQIYIVSRGTMGSWLTAHTGAPCATVVAGALGEVTSAVAPGWGAWNLGPGPHLAWCPEVASQVTLNSWNWGANPAQARAWYQELRWTVKSPTLANTNAYTYSGAVIRFGTMELVLRGGLGGTIGNSWWAETPNTSGGIDHNRSADMIYYDVTKNELVPVALGAGYSCPGAAPAYQERSHVNTGTNAAVPDEAYFFNEGYKFFEHDSCFED